MLGISPLSHGLSTAIKLCNNNWSPINFSHTVAMWCVFVHVAAKGTLYIMLPSATFLRYYIGICYHNNIILSIFNSLCI